jgi:hypothetical protein
MAYAKASPRTKAENTVILAAVWVFTAWLLYPLVFIGEVTPSSVKGFFYRSAGGIVIMIILFGKTLFDLLFPQEVSRRKSIVSVVLLTLYTFAMAGGIIFILIRILLAYLNQNSADYVPRISG